MSGKITSVRGELVDFDRMTTDAARIKNSNSAPNVDSKASVKPRVIPRGGGAKPVRGYVPKSGGSESMSTLAGVVVKPSSRVNKKVASAKDASSTALDDILGNLPAPEDLPNEDAYSDLELDKAETTKKAPAKKRTTKK